MSNEKEKAQFIYYIRGAKDGVRRVVEQIPFTVDKVGGSRYVEVLMRVRGKLVRQKVREDRIEKEKVSKYKAFPLS